jgi:hypothetical protein
MAEALQSRLTLAASEALVLFFFPMASRASERRKGVKRKDGEEDEQCGKVKSENNGKAPYLYHRIYRKSWT